MIYDRTQLEHKLQMVLSKHRYQHTVGVTCTTIPLAMNFGADVKRTEIAGVLHDCAKAYSEEEQLRMCRENNIELTEVEEKNPHLLHAKLGEFLAKTEYGIDDEEILSAIRWHTTGKPDMTLLEKIIYLADVIEPTRSYDDLSELRQLCYVDIDAAMGAALERSISYIRSCGTEPYKDSIDACVWYRTREE